MRSGFINFSSGSGCLFVWLEVPGAICQRGAWRSGEWLHLLSGDLSYRVWAQALGFSIPMILRSTQARSLLLGLGMAVVQDTLASRSCPQVPASKGLREAPRTDMTTVLSPALGQLLSPILFLLTVHKPGNFEAQLHRSKDPLIPWTQPPCDWQAHLWTLLRDLATPAHRQTLKTCHL